MCWIVALLVALSSSCSPSSSSSSVTATPGRVALSCDTFMFRGCPFVACVRADVPGSLAVTSFGECVPR